MLGYKNSAGLILIVIFLAVAVYVGAGFTSSVGGYGIGGQDYKAVRANVSSGVNTSLSWANMSIPLYAFGFIVVVLLLFVGLGR